MISYLKCTSCLRTSLFNKPFIPTHLSPAGQAVRTLCFEVDKDGKTKSLIHEKMFVLQVVELQAVKDEQALLHDFSHEYQQELNDDDCTYLDEVEPT